MVAQKTFQAPLEAPMISPSELLQGSPSWLKWRQDGIGASDSAALLGVDPYGMTPRKLYFEKIEPLARSSDLEPEHLRAGHEIEAMVRATHEFDTGEDWPSACFEHPEFNFIRASLDGWNGTTVLEIKLVMGAVIGTPVPPSHMAQCQHQMLVTGSEKVIYIRHARSTGKTEKIEIVSDRNMQRDILSACWKFWESVTLKNPPDYTGEDWVPDEREELRELVRGWVDAKTTKEKNAFREKMLAITRTPRTQCGPIKIQKAPFQSRVWAPKDKEE